MYPIDRRNVAVHIYSILHSLRKTSKLLNVSHSTIARWLKFPTKQQYSRRRCEHKSDIVVDVIKCAIQTDPFVSLIALRKLVHDVLHIVVSKELLRLVIKRQGWTKKKAKFFGQPKDLEKKTAAFFELRNQLVHEGRHFVSIDETSFGRHGSPSYGYSPKGKRLMLRTKTPSIKTKTAICCVSATRVESVKLIEGSANTTRFHAFLQSLNLPARSVVLLDNVSFHHSKVVKSFCLDHDLHLLYVPPYSPWFNPIEMAFSVVKRNYYKTQEINESFGLLNCNMLKAMFKKSLECIERF
jgi:transposase